VRVLIVDDDETFCQLLAEVLEDKGIQVVWTTDGYSRRANANGLGNRTC
jgi:DNA-binding response OmpR family regulator